MALVFRPIRDPLAEQGFLLRGQELVGFRRGHVIILVLRVDAGNQGTFCWITRHNGTLPGFRRSEGVLPHIQAEFAFPLGGIGSVAGKTLI